MLGFNKRPLYSVNMSKEPIVEELDILDRAINDPWLQSAYEPIRELNKKLISHQIDEEEAVGKITELNEGIELSFGMPMVVTGQVRQYNDSSSVLRGGIPKQINTDETYGFVDRQFEEVTIGYYGTVLETTDAGSCLKVLAARADENDEPELYGIDIDKAMVDFPSFTSYDRAVAWLQTYAPKIIEKVDEILESSEGNDAKVILGLRDVDISEAFEIGDESRARLSLDAYISMLAKPDDVLPYEIVFSGKGIIKDSESESFKHGEINLDGVFIRFDGLSCMTVNVPNGDGVQEEKNVLAILACIVTSPNTDDDTPAILFIDGLKSIKSTRYSAFNS